MEYIYQFERRYLDRFTIPGTQVLFHTIDGQLNNLPLIDISKSSIRFKYTGNLSKGDNLSFDLVIPSKEKLSLKGNIIHILKDDSNQPRFVVVQFLPFGTDDRYNTSQSRDQLNDLFNEYRKAV